MRRLEARRARLLISAQTAQAAAVRGLVSVLVREWLWWCRGGSLGVARTAFDGRAACARRAYSDSATMGHVQVVDGLDHEKYMRLAIDAARKSSLEEKNGGPFGAAVVNVSTGAVVALAANSVLATRDPTAHGEVNAIRMACKNINSHVLTGHVIYTTGEPCPMCYAACWWARLDTIYYAGSIADALEYGRFDDAPIYHAVRQPDPAQRPLPCHQLCQAEMLELWKEYQASEHTWY
ncbi:Guanine deaminase [Porphyridium purpureum]|uniref:Guanine deaminase n=1 Tax=Porphyridium purpureum TaxID=35688 RepID=A0A5J4YNI8_PORPP|nr:Guanine deaminase [Porphyridium purpureum]|eukprot:POR3198..scf249_10